ncbi:MAG TPA: ATP synthase F1 subunit delta [Candidatus Acidoferrales bacterium]|nr:ATP synthase F1 subunit delta [Candidatus Acidoferrales bacterium]
MSAVAERYAAALADVALERKSGEAVRKDLGAFVDTFLASADLRSALESPAVDGAVKNKVISAVAAKMGLNDAVRNFICLIVDHRRTHLLHEILQVFGTELNKRLGIAEAEVTTARGLNEAEKKELLSVLQRCTGKKIEARFAEDANLLGGAVVRVGSTVYDGSVREQLNRLREQLEAE